MLTLILVVVVGSALWMMERVRGEGWHLEVRWWWGSSRADGRRIRAGEMMDLKVNSRIFS
jgi:hypothetical protein